MRTAPLMVPVGLATKGSCSLPRPMRVITGRSQSFPMGELVPVSPLESSSSAVPRFLPAASVPGVTALPPAEKAVLEAAELTTGAVPPFQEGAPPLIEQKACGPPEKPAVLKPVMVVAKEPVGGVGPATALERTMQARPITGARPDTEPSPGGTTALRSRRKETVGDATSAELPRRVAPRGQVRPWVGQGAETVVHTWLQADLREPTVHLRPLLDQRWPQVRPARLRPPAPVGVDQPERSIDTRVPTPLA